MKSRKLPMEKRQNPKELSVTHTKRRQGLFSKAAELSLLCDSQIAVLVNNPKNSKVYSFGHSSVSSVITAFLHNSVPTPVVAADSVMKLNLLNETLTDSPADLFSILDEFEKSESVEELEKLVEGLEKLVDKAKAKGSPKFNCATSNCDFQSSDPLGFDFCLNYCDSEFNGDELIAANSFLPASNNGDELMAIVQQSASLSESKNCSIGNYVIGESSFSTIEEPKNWSFTSKEDFYNPFLNDNNNEETNIPYYVTGESSGSKIEEAKNWSFTNNDDIWNQFLNANNNSQDANIPYFDYWPSTTF